MTKVLVTGGTGYLGRAILARSEALDWDMVVYSRDEHKQHLASQRWPASKYVLGCVTDYQRLVNTMVSQQVDTVIHAAAVKFIPEAEYNVAECIDVNVHGSETVFQACMDAGVARVCAISTDKACLPLNTYGMTKALMEKLVVEYSRMAAHAGRTSYTACRYGNVVGSTGSVIPLFVEQAAHPPHTITLTDPYMTRYWISVDQAVDLIVDTLRAPSGSIVIPTPASMRMDDLAALIAEPYQASVKVVGVRPGEKRHEQLMHQQESVRAEFDGKNYILSPDGTQSKSEPFMLSSNDPKVWCDSRWMRQTIEDAQYV